MNRNLKVNLSHGKLKYVSEKIRYIEWINSKDLFYLRELYDAFNMVERKDNYTTEMVQTFHLLKQLINEGYIQKCSKGNLNPQYIVIKKYKIVGNPPPTE